jgi:hypothetical protein
VAAEAGFILCRGVYDLHTNPLVALGRQAEQHNLGWRGSLVLAGAQPPDGSSLPAEARFMLDHPELAPYLVNLGMISEAEKVWLYGNAGLVLYPTISEGFGLIPFEAAHYGVPCLSTRQGSLVEVLPEDIPVIEEFDAAAVAATARTLLEDPAAGQKVVDQILAKGTEFNWARVVSDVLEVLTEVTSRPACRVVAIKGEQDYAYLAGAGLGTGGTGSPLMKGVDYAIDWFLARPDIRVKIVPPGSKRQALVRQGIDQVRRRL